MDPIITMNLVNKLKKRLGSLGNAGTEKQVKVFLNQLNDRDGIFYDEKEEQFVNGELISRVKMWEPSTKYFNEQLLIFDDMLYWCLKDFTSSAKSIDYDVEADNLICLAKEAGLGNVLTLDFVLDTDLNKVTITWKNPDSATYEGREMFVSEENIISKRYPDIKAMQTAGKIVHYDGGFGKGESGLESFTYDIPSRKKYYVKVFVNHLVEGEAKTSSGRYLMIGNPDITPPGQVKDAVAKNHNYGEGIKISWTNPSDDDFAKTYLIKNEGGFVTDIKSGILLGTYENKDAQCEFTDTSIAKDVTYYYSLFTEDDAGEGYGKVDEFATQGGNLSAPVNVSAKAVMLYGYDFEKRENVGLAKTVVDFDSLPFYQLQRGYYDENGFTPIDESGNSEDDMSLDLSGNAGNIVVKVPGVFMQIEDSKIFLSEDPVPDGEEIETFYVGAFESSYNDEGMLASGVSDNLAHVQIRTFKDELSVGWGILDHKAMLLIKTLFAMEYGMDSQQLGGTGNKTVETTQTGKTLSLGNRTGTVENEVSYRGIENLWANLSHVVDGILIKNGDVYLSKGSYDSFDPDSRSLGDYVKVGKTSEGYINTIDPSTGLGDKIVDSAAGIDYQQIDGGLSRPTIGGYYNGEKRTGLFSANSASYGVELEKEVFKEEREYTGNTEITEHIKTGTSISLSDLVPNREDLETISLEVIF